MRLRILCSCLFVAALESSVAQGPVVNVKDCFSDILVDRTHITETIDLKYALQEEWSQQIYEAAKRSGALDLIIDDLPIGASYEDASQKVNNERFRRAEDLNYSDYRSLDRAALNPEAAKIINHCLDRESRGEFGLSDIPWVHAGDPTLITLQFFWHWPDRPISITTDRIDGATVEDDSGSHPKKLFAWSITSPLSYDTVSANGSRSVTLKRQRPDDAITIVVRTVPDLQLHPITIAGEAKPQKCTFGEVPPKGPNTGTLNYGPIDTSGYTAYANGQPIPLGNGAKWIWTVDTTDAHLSQEHQLPKDATITRVDCSKYGTPADYMDLLGAVPPWNSTAPGFAEGSKAECIGWWQNPSRHVVMAVHYQEYGYTCQNYEWTLKGNRWQASDTPAASSAQKP